MILNQAEREVLRAVVFEAFFLHDLIRPLFPYPRLNSSPEELIQAFLLLQSHEFILAIDESIPCQTKDDSLPVIFLTEELIKSQFAVGQKIADAGPKLFHEKYMSIIKSEKHHISYGLTPQGGELWEREMAMVDWSKYYTWRLAVLEDADLSPDQSYSRGWLTATTMETLESYIDWQLRWENNIAPEGMLTSVSFGQVFRISSWKPLYWKTLPEGFMCAMTELETRYNYESYNSEEKKRWEESEAEHDRLFSWYKEIS